jgi:hypothetical protein
LGNFWEERILETAKEKKINLLFSGWGGDEFFSSSKGGLDVDLFYSLKWKKFFEINPIKKFRSFLGTLIYSILFPTFGIMKPWVSKSYKEDLIYFNKENRVFFKKSFNNYFRYTSWKKNKIGIIYNYHISERTEMWSIQGFRFGVEYRYPFLDYRFIELILQIPPENFFKDGFLRPFIRDLTKGVLPEKVRLNNTKLDEVFHSQFIDFFLKFFPELVLEIKSWKLNKDLGIVNFSLLEKELLTFSNNRYNSKDEALVRAVVFIKMLHEFTKTYRSLPQDSE